ncbi:MAG: tRNA adenosine(34) deaminase TadA [Candidatus Thiodiazotropha sp.]
MPESPPETFQTSDEAFMKQALRLAEKAQSEGEVPVGAVVVLDGRVIGEGWNRPIGLQDPTAHAEIVALRDAGMHAQNYRLPGTTLYVTLEPCVMCAGAIVHARVERVVFAAADPKAGAAGSVFDLLPTDARFHHQVRVEGGLMEEEGAMLLRNFFRRKRAEHKNKTKA